MRVTKWAGVAITASAAALLLATPAAAHHAAPVAEVTTGDCGEVTITTTWGADEHQVDTAALVVLTGGEVTTAAIGESVTVGPFEADTTVQWRVWGGGERDYDDPPLADLGELVEWLRDNPGQELHPDVPGVAWHELAVEGCPADEEEDLEPTPEPSAPPAGEDQDDEDETGGAAGGTEDELPLTGSTATLLGGGAVLLLGLGGGAYLVARRRRVSFSA